MKQTLEISLKLPSSSIMICPSELRPFNFIKRYSVVRWYVIYRICATGSESTWITSGLELIHWPQSRTVQSSLWQLSSSNWIRTTVRQRSVWRVVDRWRWIDTFGHGRCRRLDRFHRSRFRFRFFRFRLLHFTRKMGSRFRRWTANATKHRRTVVYTSDRAPGAAAVIVTDSSGCNHSCITGTYMWKPQLPHLHAMMISSGRIQELRLKKHPRVVVRMKKNEQGRGSQVYRFTSTRSFGLSVQYGCTQRVISSRSCFASATLKLLTGLLLR